MRDLARKIHSRISITIIHLLEVLDTFAAGIRLYGVLAGFDPVGNLNGFAAESLFDRSGVVCVPESLASLPPS